MPDDDMGDANNITNGTLKHLAEHSGKSLEAVQKDLVDLLQKEAGGEKVEEDEHIKEMFEKAAQASGQTIEDAKREARMLLKQQIK